MSTIHARSSFAPIARGAAAGMTAALCALVASGCGNAPPQGAFDERLPVMEQIEEAIDQLQAERAASRSDADLGEIAAALRVNREPEFPVPEPEPAEPEPEQAPPQDERMELKLQGIIRHPRVPLAIINGKTLGAGETVARHRVERIGQDDVVLVAPDGQTVNLRLYEADRPTP